MVLSIAKQGFWCVRTRDCMASYRADNNDKYTKLDRAFGVQLWKKLYRKYPLCPMIIERPDNSAIRAKTKYDRSNLQPSQVFSTAIDHFGLVHEVFVPANKNYSCTS